MRASVFEGGGAAETGGRPAQDLRRTTTLGGRGAAAGPRGTGGYIK